MKKKKKKPTHIRPATFNPSQEESISVCTLIQVFWPTYLGVAENTEIHLFDF